MRVTLTVVLDRQMKLLLRLGAGPIALFAVIALVKPSLAAALLGLPLDLDPNVILWTIRMGAALCLPLSAFMALAAAFLPERALRQSGAVMMGFTLVICALMLISPGSWSVGRISLLVIGALFSVLYVKALRARLRHR